MAKILSVKDAPLYEEVLETRNLPFLLVCEHGGNRVPGSLSQLGLPRSSLNQHIGWDSGAAEVTWRLANSLGAAAIIANYSRAVIDLNRDPEEASSIPTISDGIVIPGNMDLTDEARAERHDELFRPFHAAVENSLERLEKRNPAVAIITIHSFTPQLRVNPSPRPWPIGVSWHQDANSAQQLLSYLRNQLTAPIGDNEPYSMLRDSGYTMKRHAEGKNRPSLVVEIRQDELKDTVGERRFVSLLSRFLRQYKPKPLTR